MLIKVAHMFYIYIQRNEIMKTVLQRKSIVGGHNIFPYNLYCKVGNSAFEIM